MFTATEKPSITGETLIFQPAGYTSALIAAPNAGVTYASLQANEDKGQLHKLSNYIKTCLLFDQLAVSQIFIFEIRIPLYY